MGDVKSFKQKHKEMIARLPAEAKRVYVEAQNGKKKWRKLDPYLVADTDQLIIREDGLPHFSDKLSGRPAAPKPQNEDIAKNLARKRDLVSRDELVKISKQDPESRSAMCYVMTAFAEEAASLKHDKENAEFKGMATSQISQRRVRALKNYMEAWLKNKEINVQDKQAEIRLDLDGPQFSTVMKLVLTTLKAVFKDSDINERTSSMILNKMGREIISPDWKLKAESLLKKAREGEVKGKG